MTDSLSYLIARLEALRELAGLACRASPLDPRDPRADWQSDHAPRLEAHRARAGALVAAGPLAALSARCGLTPLDEDILLLSLAPSIDRSFGRLMAQLRRGFSAERPDVDLVLSLLTADLGARLAALARLEPEAPLRRWGLVVLREGRGATSLMSHELETPARVQRELLGAARLSQRGQGWRASPPERGFEDVMMPEEDRERLTTLLDACARQPGLTRGASLVLLTGPSGTGKTALAHGIAARQGRPLLTVDALSLSSRVADPAAAIEEILTEARLSNAALFFDDCEMLFASRLQGNRGLSALLDALDELDDLVLLATWIEDMLDPAVQRRVLLRVALSFPSPRQRRALWERALRQAPEHAETLDLDFVAEKYEFTGGQIEVAATMAAAFALARAQAGASAHLNADDIDRAARSQLRHHLSQLAVRTVNHLTLRDIILPDALSATLRSIIAAVRNRRRIFEDWGFGERLTTGKGLAMLFRGESGTGKTLAAEILASELAMPIYRVAIPRIVSKYIGETEQNLEKAFREAQLAQAILLFDEADAIFTRRVEVSSATDRYSNMEVNLLLQELERFEGVVMLTTNLDAAIDDAFDRRLNYKLDFPFPEAQNRHLIWRRLLPDKAPLVLEEGDLVYLAERFDLSGGSIKNVVLRAAYSAAEQSRSIDIDLLEEAAVQEYKELGKLINV